MKKSHLRLLCFIFSVLLMSFSLPSCNKSDSNGKAESETEQSAPVAPNFSSESAESGETVKLSDKLGKPIVINFWASWCGPCKAELPDFEEMYKKYGDEVEFMMVNLTSGRETKSVAKAFVDSCGYTFPVYYDTMSSGAMAYGINAIPLTVFINKDGSIASYYNQMIDGVTLENGIKDIME